MAPVKTPRRCLRAGLALVCAAVGCGGDSSDSTTQAKRQSAAPPALAKAVYPRCGIEHFAAPAAVREADGWRVNYRLRQGAQQRTAPAQTSTVTLIESPPSLPRGKLQGGGERVMGGRKVSFIDRTKKTSYVAQWKTGQARYVAIVDGTSTAVLERVIACTP